MSVITFPKQEIIPIFEGEPLRVEYHPNLQNGQQLAPSASAQFVILDRFGRKRIHVAEAERFPTYFKWEVPVSIVEHIVHGTPYRIYADNGTPETRFIPQSGPLVWIT